MWAQSSIELRTDGRGTYDVTRQIQSAVRAVGIERGLCHVFCQHTSASLMLCENADPDVRRDLESFMARLTPDGDLIFRHQDEGPDDMPAHVRTVLTQSALSLPVIKGQCALGTWQGVYLWEHRVAAHARRLVITIHGEVGESA